MDEHLLHFELVVEQGQVALAANVIAEHRAQLIFARTTGASVAEDALGFLLVGQDEFVRGAVVDLDAAAYQHLAQLRHGFAVSVAGAHVEFLDRQFGGAGATQLEAAGAQQDCEAYHQQVAFDHCVAPLETMWANRAARKVLFGAWHGQAPDPISWRRC
ncbi:hypothetical protein D3C76_1437260 [compost metagenome]